MKTRIDLRVNWMAAALVAAVVFAPTATAERISLADRVTKLEQSAQQATASNALAGQSKIELQNRLNELQTEIQALRGLIEQQKNTIDELQKRNRDQYLDLDGRLARIEGGSASAASATPSPSLSASSTSSSVATTSQPTAPTNPVVVTPSVSTTPGSSAASSSTASQTPATASAADPANEQASYDTAFAALRDGRYAESARLFASFLESYPESALAPNASYWLGESYYVTQNYDIAFETFDGLLRNFGDSSKAPDALLKLGYCQFELGQVAQAERTLQEVINRYPDTTIARLAESRLRSIRLESR